MSNCLCVGNLAGEPGGAISTGYAKLDNCTFVNNKASNGAFLYKAGQTTSTTEIMNCVILDGDSEIWNVGSSKIVVEYTNLARGEATIYDPKGLVVWGDGNIEVDPCFADAGYWDPNGTPDDPNDDFFVEGDYHLKSQAGRWDSASGSWVQDEVTSPCIDAGDPNSPIGNEPFPNGGRINMGAYGGTAQASKSYFGEPVSETIIAGDINGDGKVDWLDLDILASHWLQTGEQAED
jgi:hypothetical protein